MRETELVEFARAFDSDVVVEIEIGTVLLTSGCETRMVPNPLMATPIPIAIASKIRNLFDIRLV